MNEDGSLYAETCDFQKQDASCILDMYSRLLKWGDGDHVMDVGAGEGSVSLEVLLPKLPTNFKELVLADVSSKLLDFARERCDDERVNYRQMDISSRTIPDEFRQHFDHIFSFYCLNWVVGVDENKRAMKNIFDMLKPGGDILFTIISSTPIYDFWENMAKSKRWENYSNNVNNLISPYHHLNNSAETLRRPFQKTAVRNLSTTTPKRSGNIPRSPFFKMAPETRRFSCRTKFLSLVLRNH
ncbi:juvenile hormone acid O-methyltransferase-like isoform X3 [Zophobas morio]|uniref:juvenile hormone acid O-methyltransferase-like isoform X3 n=1 Tax=Zophobas morio TaxID=2755281 RepID=UPI00308344A5